MPVPVPLIVAGLTTGANIASTVMQNRANRRAQDRAFEQNKEFWQQRFDKEAQYSSPVQQMARYKAAGLNPALMYKGGAGSSGNVSGPGTQGKIAEKYDLSQLAMMSAQTAKIVADADKSKAESEFIKAKTEGQQTSNQKLLVDLAIREIEQKYKDPKLAAELEKIIQEGIKAAAQAKTAEAEQYIIEQVHKRAAQQGIDTRSGAINMIMQGIFTGTSKARALLGEGTKYLKEVGQPSSHWDTLIKSYDFIKGL